MTTTMRRLTVCTVVLGCALSLAAAVRLEPDAAEIVVDAQAPKTVRYAADELSDLLGKRIGSSVPVVTAPNAGKFPVYLGDGAAARQAGVDVRSLPRDAFVLRVLKDRIVIAGRDDPTYDPKKVFGCAGLWMQVFERGTLFGVYEFLERLAGVRMYFPSELGTVIPSGPLTVAEGTYDAAPVFSDRSFTFCGPVWYEGGMKNTGYSEERMRYGYRMRLQTDYKPCVHGINALNLAKRFKAKHPEWFQLGPDGRRGDTPCWSSGIVDEIYLDARGYLRGDDCTTRGFNGPRAISRGWPYNCRSDRWVDLMPQDGMARCHCEKCLAAAKENPSNWATRPVWTAIARIAGRLKDEGVPGCVTCMAYYPYHDIPDFKLPDNVYVMVATTGPWCLSRPGAFEKDIDHARRWSEYMGRPVWIWTYANKWGPRTLPDVPQLSMHAWGEYYKRAKPYVTGAFCEAESDRFLYNYLNFYLFAKVAWNADLDVDATIREHHRLMFGAAEREMADFFGRLEETFMGKVVGHWENSSLGPMMSVPDEHRLWTDIYSPSLRRELGALLDAAERKVPAGSLEARRIGLFRREFFVPLDTRAADYLKKIALPKDWKPGRVIDLEGGGSGTSRSFPLDGRDETFPLLEPDTRYRLTFFLKTDDVSKLKKGGGACANVWAGYNIWLPKENWFTGTSSWSRREYVFRTRPDARAGGSYLRFALQDAEGKASFADPVLVREEDAVDLLLPAVREVVRRAPTVAPSVLDKVKVEKTTVWAAPAAVRSQAYVLDVDVDGVMIGCAGAEGERYARQTLSQLKAFAAAGRDVPNAKMTDWPALRWRGFMLDCGRNYQTPDSIRRMLAYMAGYKYNLFHWHLTDYHGWRLESKKFPQLQSAVAFGRQSGCYYTQSEFKEMLAYAAKLGITIVPELDLPGHSRAFRKGLGLERMDSPGVDRTVLSLIDELCALAPRKTMPYVHLGTDEVRDEKERIPSAWYDLWAQRVNDRGRAVLGWMPGHHLAPKGEVIEMYWYTKPDAADPTRQFIDAYPYSDSLDPLEALMASQCRTPGGQDPSRCVGAEVCSWHDDMIGETTHVSRDNPNHVLLAAMSDAYWSGRPAPREHTAPHRLPSARDADFARVRRFERRLLAQRDVVLRDWDVPFPYVEQTQMRWRISDFGGKCLFDGVAQGTVRIHPDWFAPGSVCVTDRTDRVVLETWIRSPKRQEVGALVSLNGFTRSGSRVWGAPRQGEWNTFGGRVLVNGKALLPPTWKSPGVGGNPVVGTPFADELWWIRPVRKLALEQGWNHVRIELPHLTREPRDAWMMTFVPVLGTSARPREVPDLVYSDRPPR